MTSSVKKTLLQSMTGYGESHYQSKALDLQVTIKTVNSKYLDIDARIPATLARQESSWRKLLAEKLKRGKVLFSITCELRSPKPSEILNEELFKTYAQFLTKLSQTLDTPTDLCSSILGLPGIVRSESISSISEKDLSTVHQVVEEALHKCLLSREQEASALNEKLQSYLRSLYTLLSKMDVHIEERQLVFRTKLIERLAQDELKPEEWEQEVNLSLSKLSIEEEKVRFKTHLDFFQQTIENQTIVGKKLIFIIQELGRELNTIGAKAQYSPLQHLAVEMKEIIEQMREQSANLV